MLCGPADLSRTSGEDATMRFGFFDQLPCAEGFTEVQRYGDFLAQIELGDQLGFDTAWLGELHFSRAFSISADPLMVLAAAAQRTTRIRLGTAVSLLPLHNPVKIAEQAATADILSNGRIEFGVGRGTAPLHYDGYGIPQEESRERFEEALNFILAAWNGESFSYDGKYFRARNLSVVPRPVQRPHPPVRIAANSPDTFPLAARRCLSIFATPLINPPDKLKEGLAVYRSSLPAGAAGDAALAFPVHVAASRDAARRECEPGLLRFLREAAERLRPLGETDIRSFEAFRQVLARIERVKFEDLDREMGVFGDPDYCVERVRALRRDYGIDEFICYFNQGGIMDHALVRQSMTLFAEEVMPHCR
jgi:alkanesulfonate monooxygenase SsuD/methylene tetrahydromethanopterin reductase-like flavin-dependent oxidoreductase (luciferase family)